VKKLGFIVGNIVLLSVVGYGEQIELKDLNVTAKLDNNITINKTSPIEDKYLGGNKITREYINKVPKGDGTLTGLFKANPNVQFNTGSRSSSNAGEIEPEDISINGAPFWQNNYIVDGISINNDINPAGSHSQSKLDTVFPDIGSTSQGMNLDTDIFESVEVLDSSVSAKYGDFEGGVVNVKIRDPKKDFHGKITVSHTDDSMTKFHINEEDLEDFENSTDSDYQAQFSKWKTGVTMEGFLTNDFGLLFNYNKTYSKIPLNGYTDYVDDTLYPSSKNQTRLSENYYLKGIWYVNDRLTIRPFISYAPTENTYYRENAVNSDYSYESGGFNTGAEIDYEFDLAILKQNIGFNSFSASRDADGSPMRSWKYSEDDKNWGTGKLSYEGSGGDIHQTQDTFTYNADLTIDPFEVGFTNHIISTGAEYTYKRGTFEIKEAWMQGSTISSLGEDEECLEGDEWCSKAAVSRQTGSSASMNGYGQYFSRMNYYNKGKVEATIHKGALWLQDEIEIGRFSLRPGIRVERDDYLDNTNFSYRFAGKLDIFGNDKTNITAGANRYYGRNIFAYKLRVGKLSLMDQLKRDGADDEWYLYKDGKSSYIVNENLETPYTDELAGGISQKIGNFIANAKYVHREGKKQIVATKASDVGIDYDADLYQSPTTYVNDGESTSDIYSLVIRNLNTLKLFGIENNFELSFNHTEVKRNFNDYDDKLDSDILNGEIGIILDGKIINYKDLPASDYDLHWTINASIFTKIPTSLAAMQWTNTLTYTDGYRYIDEIAETDDYYIYETKKSKRRMTWDTRLGFGWKVQKNKQLFVNVDVFNVLNKKIVAYDNGSDIYYETGRQFWVTAGYQW
jgi:hypothetical protein